MLARTLTISFIAAAGLVAAAVAAAGEPPACRAAVDQGLLEERRARFPEALAVLDRARQDPACTAAAQAALARTYNSMNDHKKALAAGRWVLANSDDETLCSAASYEIGRALYKPGRRLNQQKTAAAEAFADAVELSAGEHQKAVRALMRIYRETRQEEKVAELEERYPEIRVKTFAEQRRAIAPKMPAGGAAGGAGTAKPPRFCDNGEIAVFDPSLPHFWDPGNAIGEGFQEPVKLTGASPEIGEETAAEGVARFAVKVDAEGTVEAVGIIASLTPEIDEAIIEAVCRWTYRPAADPDGAPTACYVMDQIELPLDDESPAAESPATTAPAPTVPDLIDSGS